jgi:hypothetical protein
LEGRQRRAVYTRGEHSDLLLFGITAEEFAARHARYWQTPGESAIEQSRH